MTTDQYNPSVEIHALCGIAKTDLIAARILWNMGLIAQAIWLEQQSVEKYLKALWAKSKTFTNKKDFKDRLKAFSKKSATHGIKEVFEALPPAQKKQIKHGLSIVALHPLRYQASFGFNYGAFRSGELFIEDVRKLLGENPKSHLKEWESAAMRLRGFPKTEVKMRQAAKLIYSITNPKTKKERALERRRFRKIMNDIAGRIFSPEA